MCKAMLFGIAFAFILTGCTDDIEKVKSLVLQEDRSRTISEIFEKYPNFSGHAWEKAQLDDGRRVIIFSAKYSPTDIRDEVKKKNKKIAEKIDEIYYVIMSEFVYKVYFMFDRESGNPYIAQVQVADRNFLGRKVADKSSLLDIISERKIGDFESAMKSLMRELCNVEYANIRKAEEAAFAKKAIENTDSLMGVYKVTCKKAHESLRFDVILEVNGIDVNELALSVKGTIGVAKGSKGKEKVFDSTYKCTIASRSLRGNDDYYLSCGAKNIVINLDPVQLSYQCDFSGEPVAAEKIQ